MKSAFFSAILTLVTISYAAPIERRDTGLGNALDLGFDSENPIPLRRAPVPQSVDGLPLDGVLPVVEGLLPEIEGIL